MDAATAAATSLQHVHDPPSFPSPVPVPQPHSRRAADTHANAHAHSRVNPHAVANTHIHAPADTNVHLDGHSPSFSVETAWPREDAMPDDELEELESDASRPQDDESARASSVTTPDLAFSRPLPQQFIDSKRDQMFDPTLNPPPPPPDYQVVHPRTRPSIYSHPPPPPPPPGDLLVRQGPSGPLPRPPPPPPPPGLPTNNDPRRPRPAPPPPSPPASASDNVTSRGNEAMFPIRLRPPPPSMQPNSSEISYQNGGFGKPQGWPPEPHRFPTQAAEITAMPTHDGQPYHSRSGHIEQEESGYHSSGSSTYSKSRLLAAQSDPESGSDEDLAVFRAARQFPPLYPTYPTYGSPGADSKASAINRITTWVAEYEGTRPPPRQPLEETRPLPKPVDTVRDDEEVPTTVSSKFLGTVGDDHANGSEASEASSAGEIEVLWTKLKEKRLKLNVMKSEMSNRRKELRDLRRRKDDADNAFMSVIRPMLISEKGPSQTSPNLLEQRFADMQTLRSEYHFLEGSYEKMEVALDKEEAALNSLETRFFSLLGAGHTRPDRLPTDTDSETEEIEYFKNMPLLLKGISPHGPLEERHPLYIELLSTVGDLGNAKEEYEDLLFAKEQYDYDLEIDEAERMPPDEEEIEFRAEYPQRKQQLQDSIAQLQTATEELRQLCETKGVMFKHRGARIDYLLYPTESYEDIELDDVEEIRKKHTGIVHDRFNLLLTQPDHVLDKDGPFTPRGALKAAAALSDDDAQKKNKLQLAAKEYAIERLVLERGDDKYGDFVNRWLLYQLRTSRLEAIVLHREFVKITSLNIRDFWRWQSDVLHYWSSDGASRSTSRPMSLQSSEYVSGPGSLPMLRTASEGFVTQAFPRKQVAHIREARSTMA